MQKKINEFLDLQKIDLNIAEFEKTFETVPSKLNELRNKIDFEERKIINLKEKIESQKLELNELNLEVESANEKIKALEDKLFSINSTKEFEALQKETGDLKRLKLGIEDDQIKLMENLENSQKNLDENETKFDEEIEPLRQEIDELQKNLDECNLEKDKLLNERGEKTKELDKDLLKTYENLLRNKPPVIIPIIGESCGSCFIKIPPQTHIKVLQEEEIVLCPFCNKILISETESND